VTLYWYVIFYFGPIDTPFLSISLH